MAHSLLPEFIVAALKMLRPVNSLVVVEVKRCTRAVRMCPTLYVKPKLKKKK